MAYGLRYYMTFDSDTLNYQLDFLKKNYTGNINQIYGTDTPVVHKWATDEPFAAIKGSSLQIDILNEGVSMDDFFNVEDDAWFIELRQGGKVLFKGYLVQDDFQEDIVEYLHKFTLSATDNLGLLKDVLFKDANKLFGTGLTYNVYANYFVQNGMQIIEYPQSLIPIPLVGDTILINNTNTVLDGLFGSITSVTTVGTLTRLEMDHIFVFGSFFVLSDITIIKVANLDALLTLGKIMAIALSATQLRLNTKSFINLAHDTQFAEIQTQVYLRGVDLLNSTCYDVLANLMETFNASLSQSGGKWLMIRYYELRYGNPFFYEFDYNFITPVATGVYNNILTVGGNTVLATPLRTLIRPLKYAKSTFNFKQAPVVLKNENLNILGALLSVTTTGTGINQVTTKTYDAPYFNNGFFYNYLVAGFPYRDQVPPFYRYIKVQTDVNGNEVDRFLAVGRSNNTGNFYAAVATFIEVNKGDKFTMSYTFKVNAGSTNPNFNIEIHSSASLTASNTTRRALKNDGSWRQQPDATPNPGTGFTLGQYNTFDITSQEIPFDGRLYIYFPNMGNQETHFKNLRFTYIPQVAGQKNIKGHTHTNTQNGNIKNNLENELFFDDTISNILMGTIFKPPVTGQVINARTRNWRRENFTEVRRLGEITVLEKLAHRRQIRQKVEFDFMDLSNGTNYISLINSIIYNRYPLLKFIFGRLEIDYRNNKAGATIYELNKTGDIDTDLIPGYKFEYIYEQS